MNKQDRAAELRDTLKRVIETRDELYERKSLYEKMTAECRRVIDRLTAELAELEAQVPELRAGGKAVVIGDTYKRVMDRNTRIYPYQIGQIVDIKYIVLDKVGAEGPDEILWYYPTTSLLPIEQLPSGEWGITDPEIMAKLPIGTFARGVNSEGDNWYMCKQSWDARYPWIDTYGDIWSDKALAKGLIPITQAEFARRVGGE